MCRGNLRVAALAVLAGRVDGRDVVLAVIPILVKGLEVVVQLRQILTERAVVVVHLVPKEVQVSVCLGKSMEIHFYFPCSEGREPGLVPEMLVAVAAAEQF